MADFANNSASTSASSRLRWGRIVAGAFLLELVLIIVLIPPLQILGPEKVIPFASPAVFIFGFGVAYWIVRKIPQRRVLHGALIGVLATAIYLLLGLANPDGLSSVIAIYGVAQFVIANGLRILGCAVGAYALEWRKPAVER
jgi:hypothetical protein